jgi:2'-5' RNA ligase
MHDYFNNSSNVPGALHTMEAFGGEGWQEPDGTTIYPHTPQQPYDIVTEAMTFQFMGADRDNQLAHVKSMMSPGGIFVSEEKFRDDPREPEHEAKKDQWKAQFYSPEQLAHKETVVGIQDAERQAVGMRDLMVNHKDYEATLHNMFKYVAQIWSSGNFKGYAASDSQANLQNFLSHYQGVGNHPEFQAESAPQLLNKSYEDDGLAEEGVNKHGKADLNGSMVSMDVPEQYHSALAVKGGEKPKDLHMTLAYLPEGIKDPSGVANLLNDVAGKMKPPSATIKKLDQFPETADKDIPHIATLEGDQLHDLHQAVAAGLKALGENVSEKHDFTPHITLKYTRPDEEFEHHTDLKGMQLHFPALHLHEGGDVQEFQLGKSPMAMSAHGPMGITQDDDWMIWG